MLGGIVVGHREITEEEKQEAEEFFQQVIKKKYNNNSKNDWIKDIDICLKAECTTAIDML